MTLSVTHCLETYTPTERSVPSFVARILSRFVRCLVAIVPASQCFGQQVRPAAAQAAFEAFTIGPIVLPATRQPYSNSQGLPSCSLRPEYFR